MTAQEYMEAPDNHPAFRRQDAPEYWRTIERDTQFEGISIVVLKLLSLVASEASVERVISTQSRLILLGTCNMKDDLLEPRTRNVIKHMTKKRCIVSGI